MGLGRSGQNFVLAMSDALARCDRVVALFSAAYFERARYTTRRVDGGDAARSGHGSRAGWCRCGWRTCLPEDMPPVLRPLFSVTCSAVDAAEARRVLLEAVQGPRRPDGEPVFPGRGTAGGIAEAGGCGSAAAG